jgi:hypothetical protein
MIPQHIVERAEKLLALAEGLRSISTKTHVETPVIRPPQHIDQKNIPVQEKPKKKVVKKQIKPEPKKHTQPKQDQPEERVSYRFEGRAVDNPLFNQVASLFGLEAEELPAVDRNSLVNLIELAADKIGTVDEQQLLQFIARERHKYPGEKAFRAMRIEFSMGR